jgi:hypothetical protein
MWWEERGQGRISRRMKIRAGLKKRKGSAPKDHLGQSAFNPPDGLGNMVLWDQANPDYLGGGV